MNHPSVAENRTRRRQRALAATLATLALLMSSAATRSASAAPTHAGPTVGQAVESSLQAALDDITASGASAAVAKVVWPGGRWEGASGDASTPSSTFRAGSVTKEFLAATTLRLIEKGRLSLRTTVGSVLPRVWPKHADVTIRQLLSHTSGAPDYLDVLLDRPSSPEQYVEVFSRHRSSRQLVAISNERRWRFAPGTDWEYTNTDYIILGMMLRRVTHTALPALLDKLVFRPARLDVTRLATHPRPLPALKEIASVGAIHVPIDWFDPSNLGAAGAIVTSAGDLAQFHRALGDGTLLGPRVLRLMRTGQPEQASYGLGTVIVPSACDPERSSVYGHDGATLGTQTLSFSNVDGTRSVTVAATGLADTGAGPASLVAFLQTALGVECDERVH